VGRSACFRAITATSPAISRYRPYERRIRTVKPAAQSIFCDHLARICPDAMDFTRLPTAIADSSRRDQLTRQDAARGVHVGARDERPIVAVDGLCRVRPSLGGFDEIEDEETAWFERGVGAPEKGLDGRRWHIGDDLADGEDCAACRNRRTCERLDNKPDPGARARASRIIAAD
jgi:hypothetical protein